jgi:hypothetical protein
VHTLFHPPASFTKHILQFDGDHWLSGSSGLPPGDRLHKYYFPPGASGRRTSAHSFILRLATVASAADYSTKAARIRLIFAHGPEVVFRVDVHLDVELGFMPAFNEGCDPYLAGTSL